MTEHTVSVSSKRTWVNFAPPTLLEEVQQNLRTIMTTALGTAPGSRGIGVPWDIVDEPLHIARARMTGVLMSAISEQEPRAQVTRVTFNEQSVEASMNGRLSPTIHFILAGEGAVP
ncbi:GPW/gp25 family protein [Brevibacillus sp. MER 51]|uniref:GPW/gp25 family protein n=1 Tax=Brevibacillus sp. MER 51 TaxID=2939560 RepID=UPI00203D4F5B|nr:GPW/gp25 family protein [Brevibacillus sp. MER 51]MCM3141295.1 GPW/gp25 family protein [Brevibacillus sp. MER 51]